MHTIATFPGAIVIFASSLHPDMEPLRMMLESAGSRAIVIAENNENAGTYLQQAFGGCCSATRPGRNWCSACAG